MIEKLNEYDIKKIDMLFDITKSINVLYDKLYELEIADLKDSSEYMTYLEYLKMALEVEDERYKNIPLKQNEKILEHIGNSLSNSKSNIECIVSQDVLNRVERRIFTILNNEFLVDDYEIEKTIELFAREEGLMFPPKSTINLAINSVRLINDFLEEGLKTFLSFIQKDINTRKKLRKRLTKVKYDVAFINKNIEKELLRNTFNVDNVVIQNSEISAHMLGIEDFFYRIFKNDFGFKTAVYQIDCLLRIPDEEYNNRKIVVVALLRQALARSGFLFLDDDVIDEINFKFHEFADEKGYFENHKMSYATIIRAFKQINEDRKNHLTLSFKP